LGRETPAAPALEGAKGTAAAAATDHAVAAVAAAPAAEELVAKKADISGKLQELETGMKKLKGIAEKLQEDEAAKKKVEAPKAADAEHPETKMKTAEVAKKYEIERVRQEAHEQEREKQKDSVEKAAQQSMEVFRKAAQETIDAGLQKKEAASEGKKKVEGAWKGYENMRVKTVEAHQAEEARKLEEERLRKQRAEHEEEMAKKSAFEEATKKTKAEAFEQEKREKQKEEEAKEKVAEEAKKVTVREEMAALKRKEMEIDARRKRDEDERRVKEKKEEEGDKETRAKVEKEKADEEAEKRKKKAEEETEKSKQKSAEEIEKRKQEEEERRKADQKKHEEEQSKLKIKHARDAVKAAEVAKEKSDEEGHKLEEKAAQEQKERATKQQEEARKQEEETQAKNKAAEEKTKEAVKAAKQEAQNAITAKEHFEAVERDKQEEIRKKEAEATRAKNRAAEEEAKTSIQQVKAQADAAVAAKEKVQEEQAKQSLANAKAEAEKAQKEKVQEEQTKQSLVVAKAEAAKAQLEAATATKEKAQEETTKAAISTAKVAAAKAELEAATAAKDRSAELQKAGVTPPVPAKVETKSSSPEGFPFLVAPVSRLADERPRAGETYQVFSSEAGRCADANVSKVDGDTVTFAFQSGYQKKQLVIDWANPQHREYRIEKCKGEKAAANGVKGSQAQLAFVAAGDDDVLDKLLGRWATKDQAVVAVLDAGDKPQQLRLYLSKDEPYSIVRMGTGQGGKFDMTLSVVEGKYKDMRFEYKDGVLQSMDPNSKIEFTRVSPAPSFPDEAPDLRARVRLELGLPDLQESWVREQADKHTPFARGLCAGYLTRFAQTQGLRCVLSRALLKNDRTGVIDVLLDVFGVGDDLARQKAVSDEAQKPKDQWLAPLTEEYNKNLAALYSRGKPLDPEKPLKVVDHHVAAERWDKAIKPDEDDLSLLADRNGQSDFFECAPPKGGCDEKKKYSEKYERIDEKLKKHPVKILKEKCKKYYDEECLLVTLRADAGIWNTITEEQLDAIENSKKNEDGSHVVHETGGKAEKGGKAVLGYGSVGKGAGGNVGKGAEVLAASHTVVIFGIIFFWLHLFFSPSPAVTARVWDLFQTFVLFALAIFLICLNHGAIGALIWDFMAKKRNLVHGEADKVLRDPDTFKDYTIVTFLVYLLFFILSTVIFVLIVRVLPIANIADPEKHIRSMNRRTYTFLLGQVVSGLSLCLLSSALGQLLSAHVLEANPLVALLLTLPLTFIIAKCVYWCLSMCFKGGPHVPDRGGGNTQSTATTDETQDHGTVMTTILNAPSLVLDLPDGTVRDFELYALWNGLGFSLFLILDVLVRMFEISSNEGGKAAVKQKIYEEWMLRNFTPFVVTATVGPQTHTEMLADFAVIPLGILFLLLLGMFFMGEGSRFGHMFVNMLLSFLILWFKQN